MNEPKTLSVQTMEDLMATAPDLEIVGDPGLWRLLCKASSALQGWATSTKVMVVPGGVALQVSTQRCGNVAEAVTFIPGATLATGEDGMPIIVPLNG